MVYTDALPADYGFHLPQSSYYDIVHVDTTAVRISSPTEYKGGISFKVKCLDSDFTLEASPLILKIRPSSKVEYPEYQYSLEHQNNRITLSEDKLPECDFLLRIGYYKYAEISRQQFFFHSVSYQFKKVGSEHWEITRYTADDPQTINYNRIKLTMESNQLRQPDEVNGRQTTYITRIRSLALTRYVYQYDIDSGFDGFTDSKNHLLSGKDIAITLHNGSTYSGSLENGYFEGYGIFKDAILRREFSGNFIHGVLRKDTVLDPHTLVKSEVHPLLSFHYPIDGCYKIENVFVDSVNVKTIQHICSETQSLGIFLFKQILRFDSKGNMTEREWQGFEGYYMEDAPFVLGVNKDGKTIGVAKAVYTFDSKGQVTSETYYDNIGNILCKGSIGVRPKLFKPVLLK